MKYAHTYLHNKVLGNEKVEQLIEMPNTVLISDRRENGSFSLRV